jgi:hypothetical protein
MELWLKRYVVLKLLGLNCKTAETRLELEQNTWASV